MGRKIIATFTDHDYEQMELLARLNRIKISELLRRIVQAHLDKRPPHLKEQRP